MQFIPRRILNGLFGSKSSHNIARLNQWQLGLAGLLAIQAIAVLILSAPYSVPLYAPHLTSDTLQTQLSGKTVVASAMSQLVHINLSYVLAATLLLSALIALLLATLYKRRYEGMIKDTWQPVRWLTLAIAGTMSIAVLALLAGVQDITTLGLLKALVIVACTVGLGAEVMRLRRMGPEWLVRLSLAVAAVAALLPLLVVLLVFVATNVFGGVRVPLYQWSLFATLAVGGLLVTTNSYLALKKNGKWANYAYSEYWFIALIGLIETAFVWQVFAAVLHP